MLLSSKVGKDNLIKEKFIWTKSSVRKTY